MHDLIGTLETASEFDALGKLQPGEPYFILLGRDRLAPKLVQKWADENRERAFAEHSEGKIDDEKYERELRKSSQAESIGWEMQSFKAGDLAKKAREEPTAKTYSGHVLPEETKLSDRMQTLRLSVVTHLKNAIGEVQDLLEFVETMRSAGAVDRSSVRAARRHADRLGSTLRVMRAAVEDVTPKPRGDDELRLKFKAPANAE